MVRLIKAVGKLVSAGIFAFVLFSDDALHWLISTPPITMIEVVGPVIGALSFFAYCLHRWEKKFEPYNDRIKEVFDQIHEAMITSATGLLIRAFYVADLQLLPFWWTWQVWFVFALEGELLHWCGLLITRNTSSKGRLSFGQEYAQEASLIHQIL